jgi:hypothetical protein
MIYEGTITYTKVDETGKSVNCKESYVLEDKLSFAEVESFLFNYFGSFENVDVVAVKRSNIKEIVNQKSSEQDKIYKATVCDIFLNEDTGKEKELRYDILLFALNIEKAHAFISAYLSQGYNMVLKSLKETKYVDTL